MSSCFSVIFRVFVPAPMRNGWSWALWSGADPAGTELVRDIAELPRILRTYGRAAAQVLTLRDGRRFNVTAYGASSGAPYGRDAWLYDPQCGTFRPHGDPWVPLLQVQCRVIAQPPVRSNLPEAPIHDLHVNAPDNVIPLYPAA